MARRPIEITFRSWLRSRRPLNGFISGDAKLMIQKKLESNLLLVVNNKDDVEKVLVFSGFARTSVDYPTNRHMASMIWSQYKTWEKRHKRHGVDNG